MSPLLPEPQFFFQPKSVVSPFKRVLRWWLAVSTDDPLRRTLNQGLALTLAFVIPILITTLAASSLLLNDQGLMPLWPLVCIVAWYLNRQGTIWGAATLVIAAAFGSASLVAPSSYLAPGQVVVDAAFVFPIVIGALFISPRATIAAFLLEAAALLAALFADDVTRTQVYTFLTSTLSALGLLSAILAFGSALFFNALRRSIEANRKLVYAYDTTIEGWAHALDLRDRETQGHSRRVTTMTLRLARAMSVPEDELVHMQRGALLHDIGKMGIPDSILLKPGPLDEAEWEIMRRHPTYAFELLSPIDYLRPALDIPYCHHERWDGTGYPRGLKGREIPIAARIFAVVDVWDALRSDRPYRKGWDDSRIRAHIESLSGTHFDPAVVAAFLQLLETDFSDAA